ncbi:MAG: 50S ribosomal protein L9 [Candidatus Liptonbacteria bacterium]|nr:50S ribosomal protein L9 [Candidatus Liptonbacteria bacterium]
MKIILLQDVRKVGKKNEIKDVSDGYAKNFLIARGLAKPATTEEIKNLENRKQKVEEERKEQKEKLAALAKELGEKPLEFKVKTGKKGELFAAIGAKEIEAELKKKGIDSKVDMEKPLKALGEHQVEIDLGFGIKTKIWVCVIAEENK